MIGFKDIVRSFIASVKPATPWQQCCRLDSQVSGECRHCGTGPTGHTSVEPLKKLGPRSLRLRYSLRLGDKERKTVEGEYGVLAGRDLHRCTLTIGLSLQ